ncbi:MAG: redoxin domain-containing protein [Nitrospirae bacterium]|nr:redoxin domain-containing protein [Nitrospirota bacterium]MBI3594944.1 redoxin domain-containing protein [Nitrospirota bacterium]
MFERIPNARALFYLLIVMIVVGLAPLLLVQIGGESVKQKIGPEVQGIDEWLNTSSPMAVSREKGKVVIVDFWTYSCINCIRTIPYLNDWYDKYHDRGLVIIGIHTPEFTFEKEVERVKEAVSFLKIKYAVGLDNQKKTWDAFGNHYWPHKYFFGPDGTLRYEVVGEGRYDESEDKIQELLTETGVEFKKDHLNRMAGEEVQFQKIKTPEIFFGTFHGGFIGNPLGILSGSGRPYQFPPQFEENAFYLSGSWNIQDQFALYTGRERGEVRLIYDAKSVNWVAGTNQNGIWVEVMLDRHYLNSEEAGEDIVIDSEGRSKVFVSQKKLYRIIRHQGGYGKHLLSLILFEPGVESYSFTFG